MRTLSISIMGHPKRAEHIALMEARLASQAAETPGVTFLGTTLDVDSLGTWSCCRRAWEAGVAYGADFHLVLQDDVVFCADLPAAVLMLLDHILTPVVLFHPKKSMDTARIMDDHQVRLAPLALWGQAVLMRTSQAKKMLAWLADHDVLLDGQPGWNKAGDDSRIGAYFSAHRVPVRACAPSLVDHIGTRDQLDSILKNYAGHRTARWFVGVDGKGCDVAWGSGGEVRE